jgi:CheY-like chemotaxis protein
MALSFIVIDESELDCFIARKIIQNASKGFDVEVFQNPLLAFDRIKTENYPGKFNVIHIILLDLQMPLMNGFEFVEAFEKLEVDIQQRYHIHILSSTRNKNDINRLLDYASVFSVIEKPLTAEKLQLVIKNL